MSRIKWALDLRLSWAVGLSVRSVAMPDEYEIHQNKRPSKTYISKSIDTAGGKIRIASKVHSNDKTSARPSVKELAYREFLMYATFFAAKAPVIVSPVA